MAEISRRETMRIAMLSYFWLARKKRERKTRQLSVPYACGLLICIALCWPRDPPSGSSGAPERDRGAAGRPMLRSRRVYRALSEPKRGVVGHCGADPIIWPGAWPRLPHGTGERELREPRREPPTLRHSLILCVRARAHSLLKCSGLTRRRRSSWPVGRAPPWPDR